MSCFPLIALLKQFEEHRSQNLMREQVYLLVKLGFLVIKGVLDEMMKKQHRVDFSDVSDVIHTLK